jgi:hypothetical protein
VPTLDIFVFSLLSYSILKLWRTLEVQGVASSTRQTYIMSVERCRGTKKEKKGEKKENKKKKKKKKKKNGKGGRKSLFIGATAGWGRGATRARNELSIIKRGHGELKR